MYDVTVVRLDICQQHNLEILVNCYQYNILFCVYFFNLKKSAAKAHRLLVETYGKAALSERSCREWLQKFKNGKFDIEDKECSGRPKVYEDAELKALLD